MILQRFTKISVIWICITGISVANIHSKLWQKSLSISGKLKMDENCLISSSASVSHCASRCTAMSACRSFFYNEGSRTCVGHNRIPGVSEMTTSIGYDMYYGSKRPDYCPSEFTYDVKSDMCYRMYDYRTMKKANDARSFCEGLSGHLVRVDTKERHDVIINDPILSSNFGVPFFVDGRLTAGGEWFTYNNNRNVSLPFDEDLWMTGEPNKSASEDMCIYISDIGEWVDHSCSVSTYSFICELSS